MMPHPPDIKLVTLGHSLPMTPMLLYVPNRCTQMPLRHKCQGASGVFASSYIYKAETSASMLFNPALLTICSYVLCR